MKHCPKTMRHDPWNTRIGGSRPCPMGGACQELTDEQIVEQIKKNQECFIYLLDRYQEKMKRYVTKISGLPLESVQDLVQEIFLKVYINLEKFDTNQKFSSWIYRIARNETINFWLYSKRRKTENWDVASASQNFIGDGRNIENEIYQKITNEKLIESFRNINEKYQEVLILNYLEEKSYREIAKELEKPVATVGTLLNRGKKLLKEELLRIGLTPDTALG